MAQLLRFVGRDPEATGAVLSHGNNNELEAGLFS
jgi:hypothetical protein